MVSSLILEVDHEKILDEKIEYPSYKDALLIALCQKGLLYRDALLMELNLPKNHHSKIHNDMEISLSKNIKKIACLNERTFLVSIIMLLLFLHSTYVFKLTY